MKSFVGLILVLGVFFFASSSLAAESKKPVSEKTRNHQCAMLKQNALKAKKLYAKNRAKAEDLNKKVKDLKNDQTRMPASAKKKVVTKIQKLSDDKIQKLAMSLKYLEKHLYFAHEAKKSCTAPVKAEPQPVLDPNIDIYFNLASNQ